MSSYDYLAEKKIAGYRIEELCNQCNEAESKVFTDPKASLIIMRGALELFLQDFYHDKIDEKKFFDPKEDVDNTLNFILNKISDRKNEYPFFMIGKAHAVRKNGNYAVHPNKLMKLSEEEKTKLFSEDNLLENAKNLYDIISRSLKALGYIDYYPPHRDPQRVITIDDQIKNMFQALTDVSGPQLVTKGKEADAYGVDTSEKGESLSIEVRKSKDVTKNGARVKVEGAFLRACIENYSEGKAHKYEWYCDGENQHSKGHYFDLVRKHIGCKIECKLYVDNQFTKMASHLVREEEVRTKEIEGQIKVKYVCPPNNKTFGKLHPQLDINDSSKRYYYWYKENDENILNNPLVEKDLVIQDYDGLKDRYICGVETEYSINMIKSRVICPSEEENFVDLWRDIDENANSFGKPIETNEEKVNIDNYEQFDSINEVTIDEEDSESEKSIFVVNKRNSNDLSQQEPLTFEDVDVLENDSPKVFSIISESYEEDNTESSHKEENSSGEDTATDSKEITRIDTNNNIDGKSKKLEKKPNVPGYRKEVSVSGNSVEKLDEVCAPRFKCFDSYAGRIHYFVAPRNDHYCTNSLQYLDYNEFLYNLLKDQGYERVIIVSDKSEDRGDNYPVLTYDAFSQFSFLNPSAYKERFQNEHDISEEDKISFCQSYLTPKAPGGDAVRSVNSGKRKSNIQNQETIPLYGKRIIRTLTKKMTNSIDSDTKNKPKEIFENFIVSEVDEAMRSTIQRTAVVIPIELFFERDNQKDDNSSWLNSLVEKKMAAIANNTTKNIILVTADQKESFEKLFNGRVQECFSTFDKEFAKAIASFQEASEPLAYCSAFVSELDEKGRILIAKDRPQIDEIANYFFMKKVKGYKGFERLPYSKVYSLAEFLYDNCATSELTKETFPELDSNTWCLDLLDKLNLEIMGNRKTLEALIDVALGNYNVKEKVWDKKINRIKNLRSTSIERINGTAEQHTDKKTKRKYYSAPMSRFSFDEAERKAIISAAQNDLNKMIGLRNVKRKVEELAQAAVNSIKRENSVPEPGNYIFEGHTGTGKTEVARLMGKMLHAAGILRRGHTVEVSAGDLIAGYVGQTAIKTLEKCEEALDGVLFIDEAYQLVNTDRTSDSEYASSFASEAYTTLLKYMEDHRSRICVIAAGYPDKMNAFRTANDGMSSRIPDDNVIRFDDYSIDELIHILKYLADQKKDKHQEGYVILSDEFLEEARATIEELKISKGEQFGNGRDVRSLLEMSLLNAEKRPYSKKITLIREDIEANRNVRDPEAAERAWAALDEYVGLKNIKTQLKEVVDFARGTGIINFDSMIFAGPPGTGKSEVARLVAPILKAEGILKTDTFVKADKLKGRALGETESNVLDLCKKAKDGVLFVDEAYGLVNERDSTFKDSYAEEAYLKIMQFMTENKNHIVVIFAGYPEMMQAFNKANAGLSSRVEVINFDPYSDDELYEIFQLKAKEYEKRGKRIHISFSDDFSIEIKDSFSVMRSKKGNTFGNARDVQKLLTDCIKNALNRIETDTKRGDTLLIEAADIPEKYRKVESNLMNTDTSITEKPLLKTFYISKDLLLNIDNPFDMFGKQDPQGFIDYCKRATMRVHVKDNYGTMFAITPDGYGITCAHVILGKNFDDLITSGSVEYLVNSNGTPVSLPFDVVAVEEPYDLALIKVSINGDLKLPYLKLASEKTKVDDTYNGHLYGFPDGKPGIKYDEWKISSEEERRPSGIGDVIRYLSVKAFPGDSGGPVVSDDDGLVIGVLQGAQIYSNGQSMSIMKPITNGEFWKNFVK